MNGNTGRGGFQGGKGGRGRKSGMLGDERENAKKNGEVRRHISGGSEEVI